MGKTVLPYDPLVFPFDAMLLPMCELREQRLATMAGTCGENEQRKRSQGTRLQYGWYIKGTRKRDGKTW